MRSVLQPEALVVTREAWELAHGYRQPNRSLEWGDGTGPGHIQHVGQLVLEFMNDQQQPRELAAAAAAIWLACEHTPIEGLKLSATIKGLNLSASNDVMPLHVRSRDGWSMQVLRYSYTSDVWDPQFSDAGLLFTRPHELVQPNTNSDQLLNDVYVYVAPGFRGEGVATAALRPLGDNLNVPFAINLGDPAVSRLINRYNITANGSGSG